MRLALLIGFAMAATACEFCTTPGGPVLWESELCRVVRVDEPDYPGFCRVILNRHAVEMTDLAPAERDAMMRVVYEVEAAIRQTLRADKMNLASDGPDPVSVGEQLADIVDRLAAGEKGRQDLRVPRAELVINKKIAGKLKIDVPAEALKAASRVF